MLRHALLLLALTTPALAQEDVAVDIIEYGTYVTSGDSPSPDSKPDAVVELRTVHDPRFVERTDTVPGQLCQRFGIRFVLRPGPGIPPIVHVTVHVDHPRLVNPDGRSSDSEEWPQFLAIGVPSMAGFDFDQGWEVAPGDWTMSVQLDGRTLAAHTFHVTDVPGGAGPGDGCLHLS